MTAAHEEEPVRWARTRSFTRRGGRIPEQHKWAYEKHGDAYILDLPTLGDSGSTAIDPSFVAQPSQWFGRKAPVVLEVGSGSGDALVAGAQAHPDWDFIAFEVWRPGVAQAIHRLQRRGLTNVRFATLDAHVAFDTAFEPGSIAEVWTYFPDPWPKTKHHKRRIVGPVFADRVNSLLSPSGLWRLATDWPEYADHMHDVLDDRPDWSLVSTEREESRPITRFERKGTKAGRPITDLAYAKVEPSSEPS